MKKIAIVLMLLFVGLYPVNSSAEETITWPEIAFPPFDIQSGPYKDKGLLDESRKILQQDLTDYQHERGELINFKRMWELLRKGEKICYAGVIRSSLTEPIGHLSVPMAVAPSFVLIIRKDKSHLFENKSIVSLKDVLEKSNLHLGISSRGYGDKINAILDKHKGDSHIHVRSGLGNFPALMKMLFKDRLDYVLAYPSEGMYQAKLMNKENEIAIINLKETYGDVIVGRVICPKTDWGRKIIKKCNAILKKKQSIEKFRDIDERWVSPNIRKGFRKQFDDVIATDTWTSVD
ncbi:MAG: TIGR02285 family protein [Nitrospina sp.]|nr:TIGR02285 family protein [Nitrospina sp.]